MKMLGRCSTFGGPLDTGMSSHEGLALFDHEDIPSYKELFLPSQPHGTTGLGRRLNPSALYCAMRWNYRTHSRDWLRTHKIQVRKDGVTILVQPVDWGPNADTGRLIDLSPGAARALGVATDEDVEVILP